jgi:DNA-binding NarL/FixJ family response regulator
VVRQGTRDILNRYPHFSVVGECASEEGLAELIQQTKPDVLLLDINLPGKNGLQLLAELKPQFPKLKIILFSAHSDLQYIRKAQQLKADGFLSKTISEPELQDAIAQAMAPELPIVFSADVHSKLQAVDTSSHTSLLTAREQEILIQLAQGHTNQGIAKALCVSVKTVDTHVANLMKKTGVNKRTQLLAYAYEHGLI